MLKSIRPLDAGRPRARPVPRLPAGAGRRARLARSRRSPRCKLALDSWRWQGVPFYIRAGKCLPGHVHRGDGALPAPADDVSRRAPRRANHVRFRISPEVEIALGATVMDDRREVHRPSRSSSLAAIIRAPDEMDAYERVLGDAMAGDATLFAREDYVEEAWRIVDPCSPRTRPCTPTTSDSGGPRSRRRSRRPAAGTIRRSTQRNNF